MKIANVIAALLLLLPALAGCDLPRDPQGTLDKVRGGTITVGVNADDEPADPRERAALERLAGDVGADLSFRVDELHTLIADLEGGRIDMIAGHIPKTTPFAEKVGLSASVSRMTLGDDEVKTVFAVRKGENGFLTAVETAIGETQ